MPQQCWKRSPKYQGLESIADKKKSSVHRQDPETFTKEVISSELLSFVQRKHAFEAFEGLRVEGEGEGGRRGGSLQTSKVRNEGFEAFFEAFKGSKPSRARTKGLSKPSKPSFEAFEGFEGGFEAFVLTFEAFEGFLKVCFSIFKFILFFFVFTPLNEAISSELLLLLCRESMRSKPSKV